MFIPGNPLDTYMDFHGLYGSTINDRTATKNNVCFVKTMLENSLVTQENVRKLKNSRPCTRETRPKTAFSTIKSIIHQVESKDELGREELEKNYETMFLKKDVLIFLKNMIFC